MYLFLYGEDTFRARQKLNLIKTKYLGRVGNSLNLVVKEGEGLEWESFAADLSALPFLATTRLAVIKNPFGAPIDIQRKLADWLPKIPDSTVAVFWQEGLPPANAVLFKALNRPKAAERFNLLGGDRLSEWINIYVKEKGGEIAGAAVEILKEACGSDLFRLSSEIDKLLAYNSKISEERIRKLTASDIKINAFDMVENLISGRFSQALRQLHELLLKDEEPLKILGALVYQIRQLILVSSLPGGTPPYEIARRLKISPFAVYRSLRALKRVNPIELPDMHEELMKADIALKTGIIEPRLGLWFLAFNLTRPQAKIKYWDKEYKEGNGIQSQIPVSPFSQPLARTF